MTTITQATAADEWGTEPLDLDAYLRRIGHDAPSATDADALRSLHRAHAATIPFENLDIVVGRGIELDLERVQDKLVRRARGGYCFEHNLLLAAALERLGYPVTRLAGRVQPGRPGPRTHMLLRVVAGGRPWLADVGFGASLLEPLPLESTSTTQGGWRYRLDRSGHDGWLLRSGQPDGWSDMYAFTLEPQRPIDYAVYNHYTATHPRSPFVGQIVALRTDPHVKYALRGRALTTTRADGSTQTRTLALDELVAVLADRFGIRLPAEDERQLRRAVAPLVTDDLA